MNLRLDHKTADPAALQVMMGLEKFVRSSDLPAALIELIYTRASQLNGCAFCLEMHTREARAKGESETRLSTLSAWRDTPFFTAQERAGLAFTECVVRIGERGVPDNIYAELENWFSQQQIVQLIMAVNAINAWNRIAIVTGMQPVWPVAGQ